MNAEKYLQTVRTLKFKIDKYEEIRSNMHLEVSFGGMATDGIRVQSTKKDQLEEAAIRLMERLQTVDTKLAKLRGDYIERRLKAYDRIMKIEEGQCRRFLIDYYIDCKSIKDLKREYGYSEESGIYQLKKRSVKKFEKSFKQ